MAVAVIHTTLQITAVITATSPLDNESVGIIHNYMADFVSPQKF